MKSILDKLPHRKSLGLVINERQLVLSMTVITALGATEVERRTLPLGGDSLQEALRKLLEPLASQPRWLKAPVYVGLPALGVFFSSRPIKALLRDAAPQALLHEILQSSNLNVDDMEVDMLRLQPGKQAVASIVACRKKYLSPILECLADCGLTVARIEPAPCALVRAAQARYRTPRRASVVLRIFVGSDSTLAVLCSPEQPLLWRSFRLQGREMAATILTALRAMGTLCQYVGLQQSIDTLMIHGARDLASLGIDPARDAPGVRMSAHEGPALDAEELATVLAQSCQNPELETFNLIREVAPPAPVLSMVPIGQIAFQVVVLAAATGLMIDDLRRVETSGTAIEQELTSIDWLKNQPDAKLEAERKELTTRVESAQKYLASRILWTECLREVATRLPPDMVATAIDGQSDFNPAVKDPTKLRRSFTVALEVPTPVSGAIPPEVNQLLTSLRSSKVLSDYLPTIEMAALRWGTSRATNLPAATFSVVCQPPPKGSAKKRSETPSK